jgi:hypothetical protein
VVLVLVLVMLLLVVLVVVMVVLVVLVVLVCIYCPCYIGRAGSQLHWVVATNIASIITYNMFAEYNPRRNHDRA